MDPQTIAILAATALLTSIISGIVGMAGGIILLAVMLLFLDPLVAIPIHGAVQLVANGTRTWVQRRHVVRPAIAAYCVLLVPGSILGLIIAQELSPAVTRLLIGVFVLAATWAPAALLMGTHPENTNPRLRFVTLGACVGVINMTVGASGPFIAPFFLNLGMSRQGIIGTKAASQALGHLTKILVFGVAGFAFATYAPLLVSMSAMGIFGTWLGSRLLDSVSEVWFTRCYKTALTLVGLQLVINEGWALFR